MKNEGGVLDTFDEGPYSGDEIEVDDSVQDSADDIADMEDYESMDSFDEEESSTETAKVESFDEDSQVNLLEDQEEKGTPEAKKEEAPKDEKSEEEDTDAEKEPFEKDETASVEEDIRNLKAFREGKAYEVPEDAQINVKINGKSEKVALKDLRDNYSGQVAYDKKFTELSEEKETFKSERDAYQTEIDELSGEMKGIRDLVTQAQAGEAHPLAGFEKLLDLMGVNSVTYSKQMQEQMFEEYDIFSEMSDAERDAHWLQKENNYLVDKQESEHSRSSANVARQEHDAQIHQLRETHGVSENDFNSAYQDLLSADEKDITAERVIQVAQLNPLMDVGEEIMSKYEEQLSTDQMNEMVREIAITMYNDPSYTKSEIASMIAEDLEVETLVSEVNSTRRSPEALKVPKSKRQPESGYESFDDWE